MPGVGGDVTICKGNSKDENIFCARQGKTFLLRRAGETWNGRGRSSMDLYLGGGIRGRVVIDGLIVAGAGGLGSRSS